MYMVLLKQTPMLVYMVYIRVHGTFKADTYTGGQYLQRYIIIYTQVVVVSISDINATQYPRANSVCVCGWSSILGSSGWTCGVDRCVCYCPSGRSVISDCVVYLADITILVMLKT